MLSLPWEQPVPDEPVWLDPLQRVGLALSIGFLVGVERGWKQRDDSEGQRVAGIRTFALIGLLGGVCGLLFPAVGAAPVAAMTLAFGAAFAAFQFRQAVKDSDNSVTSTVAGLLVFALGFYAVVGETVVAAAAAVAGTIVLAFKEGLHNWVRSITWKEMRSALLILAATCIALPLMPEGAVDPWGAVEPRSLWWLTILIASASFAGYVALRALGPRAGLMIGALAGAVVSSTVVTIDLSRRVRASEIDPSSGAAAAALATAVSLIRCGGGSFAVFERGRRASLAGSRGFSRHLSRMRPGPRAAGRRIGGGRDLRHYQEPAESFVCCQVWVRPDRADDWRQPRVERVGFLWPRRLCRDSGTRGCRCSDTGSGQACHDWPRHRDRC